jgi:hypothetical protein
MDRLTTLRSTIAADDRVTLGVIGASSDGSRMNHLGHQGELIAKTSSDRGTRAARSDQLPRVPGRRFARAAAMVLGVVLTAGSFLALTAVPTRAAALPLGSAWATPFKCVSNDPTNGNMVYAAPPNMTTVSGQLDNVYWHPDLYRWNGTTWVAWITSKPWAQAAAGSNGTVSSPVAGATWFIPPTAPIHYLGFVHLPAGYYAMLDRYQWENGVRGSTFVPYNQGGYYCSFQ